MASPPNSQQSSAGYICLSLVKYSFATVAIESVAPVPWVHVSSKNNLFAIFETAKTRRLDGTIEERPKFKVLRDPEIMEDLDLEVLAQEAQQAINLAKDAQSHNQDHNVAIIVKVPVIAIKYPMNDGQVRRFQIRFTSDENYYDAMKMLSRAHVPTIEAGTFPQRPQTANFANASNPPNKAYGNGGQLNNRPVSAAPNLCASASVPSPMVSPSQAASLSQRPATSASVLMPPPTHFNHHTGPGRLGLTQAPHQSNYTLVSGEKNAVLASVDKQHSTSIDLYTPRPSLIPATTSQHYSQLLPPRRELPFEKANLKSSTAPSASRVLRSASKPPSEPETTLSKPDSTSGKPKKAPARKSTSAASQSSTQKRKRNTTTAGETAATNLVLVAKKGRNARKTAPKPTKDLPLPSIDEVLEGHDYNTFRDSNGNMEIDTQALLSRAEQVANTVLSALKSNGSSPTKPTVAAISNHCETANAAAQVEVPNSSVNHAPISPEETAPNVFPCTPANQIINASTPSAPIVQHTVDTAPDPASPSNTSNPLPAILDAYSLLMQHPGLANSDANIAAWAALPEQQRSQAIQNFVCEQYMDKSGAFEMLCKVMEGSWEASIVWPEVYKQSR